MKRTGSVVQIKKNVDVEGTGKEFIVVQMSGVGWVVMWLAYNLVGRKWWGLIKWKQLQIVTVTQTHAAKSVIQLGHLKLSVANIKSCHRSVTLAIVVAAINTDK